jgi:hypothetical protein
MENKTYEYIEIGKEEHKELYYVKNRESRDVLGAIEYYNPWKKHVFSAEDTIFVFDSACLRNIIEFMEELDKQVKEIK